MNSALRSRSRLERKKRFACVDNFPISFHHSEHAGDRGGIDIDRRAERR